MDTPRPSPRTNRTRRVPHARAPEYSGARRSHLPTHPSTEGVYSRDMGRGNSREGGGGSRRSLGPAGAPHSRLEVPLEPFRGASVLTGHVSSARTRWSHFSPAARRPQVSVTRQFRSRCRAASQANCAAPAPPPPPGPAPVASGSTDAGLANRAPFASRTVLRRKRSGALRGGRAGAASPRRPAAARCAARLTRGRRAPAPPPFLPRTNRTSLVPPLVLSGHAASLTRVAARASTGYLETREALRLVGRPRPLPTVAPTGVPTVRSRC